MGAMRKKILLLTAGVALAAFAAGAAAGILWQRRQVSSDLAAFRPDQTTGYAIRQGGYRFINPLLECEISSNPLLQREITPFRQKVELLVGDIISRGLAREVSVYWRDLNNGPWFGINENEGFAPASLLKVPVMIAALKKAEDDPAFLSRRILHTGARDMNDVEFFKGSQSLEKGKIYTVEDLIRRAIVYSDNNASLLLISAMEDAYMDRTFLDLGLPLENVKGTGNEGFISIKQYGSFFRVLFNASYLGKDLSERALSWLSQVEFKKGLSGGTPPGVPLAHKFGERAWEGEDTFRQLHDCGIVYYPNRPYLLGVMTRGGTPEGLAETIRQVSRLVWEEIDRQTRQHKAQEEAARP
jgi:beta-lactamase class A